MAEIKSESVADFIPEWVADFPRNTHFSSDRGHHAAALMRRKFLTRKLPSR
jgi:hypothetical protein